MKILMTTDAVGGVWQYSLDLAAGLSRFGIDFVLATLGPRPTEQQKRQARAISRLTLVEGDYPLEWMDRPWSGVDACGKWLLELQAGYGADLIHLNGYSHASLPWDKPVVIVAHSCVFSWWRAVHGTTPGSEWTEYKSRVTRGLNAASAVVAPTKAMACSLTAEYGVTQDKIRVIHNFSQVSLPVRSEKQPLILAAGRIWDEAKRLKILSELADRLQWELYIADGTLAHTDLLRKMAQAGIFAHPALYEPFGLAVLEAARAQCCLVLADIPSLRELWDGASVFVSPRDEQGWLHQLNSLSKNDQERDQLAQSALARSRHYDGTTSLEEYCKLYNTLFGSRQAKRRESAA